MSAIALRRQLTAGNINFNPCEIELTRTIKQDGGLRLNKSVLSSQTVRIYLAGRGSRVVVSEGIDMVSMDLGMLCKWDADIMSGDTFELNSKQYEIIKVVEVGYLGEVVAKQCEIRELE
jgi:hypothetical protein